MKLRSSSMLSKAFIILQIAKFLSVSSADTLPGLSLSQFNRILFSEAPVDFDNNNTDALFSAAMEFEWDRANNDQNGFSFLVCDSEPDLSGNKRKNITREALEINDKQVWFQTVYNKDDQTCFLTYMGGTDLVTAYTNLSPERKIYIKAQPMSQSMKMGVDTVNEIQKQLDGESSDQTSDFGILSTEITVDFAVSLCPGVIEGGMDNMQVANAILDTLQTNPTDISSSSFFYDLVQDKKLNGANARFPELTDRIEFWAEALEYLNSGNCTEIFTDAIDIIGDGDPEVIAFQAKLSGEGATRKDEMCIWSLIQASALHPTTCHLDPSHDIHTLVPMEEKGKKDPQLRNQSQGSPAPRMSLFGSFISAIVGTSFLQFFIGL